MIANGEDRKEKDQKDTVDENYFQTRDFKIKQMRNKMEDEKMEALRKLPLNVVNQTSFSPLKINNIPQGLRNSTTERVM